jgi:glucose-1-phosphate thymidylyltransferase
MKVVLLAGGYATRLWPLTKNTPKALLEVGERTIMEHVLHLLEKIPSVSGIYLTTNEKFAPNFRKFLETWKGSKPIEVVVENTRSNSKKYGTVGGLLHLLRKGLLNERVMVMAADNVFDSSVLELLNSMAQADEDAVILHDTKDLEIAKSYGVCKVDASGLIVDFEEKPEKPKSALVSTGCYVLRRETLAMMPEYEASGGGMDRMGDFIKWLVSKRRVRGHVYAGKWFDIGTHEQLARAKVAHGAKK